MSIPVQIPKSLAIHNDLNTHENDVAFMGSFELDETLNRAPDPRWDPAANKGDDNGAHGVEASSAANDVVQIPITERDVSVATLPRLSYAGRKKGKGQSKSNAKKELAIKEKFLSLLSGLNPMPFIPDKIHDFSTRERLMKKLGLWNFVKIDFDRNIRADFIAQLVASYEPKSRSSYVNGFRIMVNRAALGRALRLSVKKEKGNNVGGGVGDVDLDWEASSEDCLWLVEQFLFGWLILHGDSWLRPREVSNWLDAIRDGHPEKVDWAGLVWFMAERELALGSKLKNCYYTSHLQLLIKSQREELFLVKDYACDSVELEMGSKEEEEEGDEEEKRKEANYTDVDSVGNDAEEDVKGKHVELCAPELTFAAPEESKELYEECMDEEEEEKHDKVDDAEVDYGSDVNEGGKQDEQVNDEGDVKEGKEEENCLICGPSTKLTLEQDSEEEEAEEMKEMEVMYSEKYKDNLDEVSEEENQGKGQWLLHGKNYLGEHFMQHCENDGGFHNSEGVKELDDDDDDEEEDDEEEEEDVGDEPIHGFPNYDSTEGNGFIANLLQTIEGTQIAFGSQQQLHPSPSMLMQSFSNHFGKRTIGHVSDLPHHELHVNNNNKRTRTNDPYDNSNGPNMDFRTCMHQIQQMAEKARIMHHEQKQHDIHLTSMNQRILLNEVEKRDRIINQLQKTRADEIRRKDTEIYRLNHELFLMESVVDGYRKALKQTQRAFDEYRERARLREEPVYRDAWPGGLMLSVGEIEAFRRKFETNCSCIESQICEAEAHFVGRLGLLEGKLRGLEGEAKELFRLNAVRKNEKAEAYLVCEAEAEEEAAAEEDEEGLDSVAGAEGGLLGASKSLANE